MNRKFCIIVVVVFSVMTARAQIGGEKTYQFLELTNSARVAALGGTQVAFSDTADLNLPFHNPALLHRGMNNHFLVNYVRYFADIYFGYASYARHFQGVGNFAVGMQFIDYGDFNEATEQGIITGNTFTAAEYALNMIYSGHYRRLRYGINLKPLLSVFESYRSFGLVSDFGVGFCSKDSLTHVGVAARNLGGQLTTYYEDGKRESVPFNLQAGISRRFKYAPVILSLTMHHLNHWDLADPGEETTTLENMHEREESIAKQAMRHVVLGIEVLPSENFSIRAGYNYQRRQELKFEEKLSTVGFSLGFGIKINRFRFDFATSRFHLAGGSNLFSLAVDLNDF